MNQVGEAPQLFARARHWQRYLNPGDQMSLALKHLVASGALVLAGCTSTAADVSARPPRGVFSSSLGPVQIVDCIVQATPGPYTPIEYTSESGATVVWRLEPIEAMA